MWCLVRRNVFLIHVYRSHVTVQVFNGSAAVKTDITIWFLFEQCLLFRWILPEWSVQLLSIYVSQSKASYWIHQTINDWRKNSKYLLQQSVYMCLRVNDDSVIVLSLRIYPWSLTEGCILELAWRNQGSVSGEWIIDGKVPTRIYAIHGRTTTRFLYVNIA